MLELHSAAQALLRPIKKLACAFKPAEPRQGLLVVADHIADHFGHSCLFASWTEGAAHLVSRKNNVPIERVFKKASSAVTDDDLTHFQGVLSILGITPGAYFDPPDQNRILTKMQLTGGYASRLEPVAVVPSNTADYVARGRPIDIVVVEHTEWMSLYSLDLAQSQELETLELKEYFQSQKTFPPAEFFL